MELLHGRPETNEGRLPKEIRVYDMLDRLGIDYEYTRRGRWQMKSG